ncbi:GAF domain-containing protein [Variovorax sp. E3]|uniref:GAF domain-containing protein n=1 Tax=Variovorax sp. E3 TaxID=1914993 RepID=UPI0018DE8F9D|nr:GAF domain-containing protein [Variovorax sp. E3]
MRNSPQRLALLRRLALLDTSPQRVFDDLTRTLSHSFGVPVSMVNLLDEQRDWFLSCVGLPMTESPAATSFCEVFFRTDEDFLVAEDAALHPAFADHPLVKGPPHVRFYAASRLVLNGQTVGTLCAYDFAPRRLPPGKLDELRMLAAAAMDLLQRRFDEQAAQDSGDPARR